MPPQGAASPRFCFLRREANFEVCFTSQSLRIDMTHVNEFEASGSSPTTLGKVPPILASASFPPILNPDQFDFTAGLNPDKFGFTVVSNV
jgi:hypothetical protein